MKLGFEIEIEDVVTHVPEIPGIQVTTDGSLRNGIELISSPLPDVEFATFLYTYVYDRLQGNYSERCGFHFHMDFTTKSKEERMSFLFRYLKVERTLFREYPDLFRSHNNFCPLLLDSPNELAILRKYNQSGSIRSLENFSKYSALNFKPLIDLGTVEFRAAPAGLSPLKTKALFQLFENLYTGSDNRDISAHVTPEDLAEAESVITIINTPIQEASSELGDFMGEHFEIETPTSAPTEQAIREFLRGLN